MLRAWQVDPFLDSLRLIIETSLPPRCFPLSGPSSLWTRANRLDVSRINLERLTPLAEPHAVYSSAGEREALGELVGWNIYLCRLALFHAVEHEASLAAALTAHQPTQHAFDPFADHLEGPCLQHDAGRGSRSLDLRWTCVQESFDASASRERFACIGVGTICCKSPSPIGKKVRPDLC